MSERLLVFLLILVPVIIFLYYVYKGYKSDTKESLPDQMISKRSPERAQEDLAREDISRLFDRINSGHWERMRILNEKEQAAIVHWLIHCSEYKRPELTRIAESVDPVIMAVRYSDEFDAVIASLLAYARVRENSEMERLAAVDILRRLSDERTIPALRTLSQESGPVGLKASELLGWLEPEVDELSTAGGTKEMDSLFQRASNISAPFEESNTKDPKKAADLLLDEAILSSPCITEKEVQDEFESLRYSWSSRKLVKGSPSLVKGIVFKNLTRIASRSDFRKFKVEVLSNQKCAQVSAYFESTFTGVRVWLTRDSVFACGNADFITE